MNIVWNAKAFCGVIPYHGGKGRVHVWNKGTLDAAYYGDYWRSLVRVKSQYGWETISY